MTYQTDVWLSEYILAGAQERALLEDVLGRLRNIETNLRRQKGIDGVRHYEVRGNDGEIK